MSNYSNVFQVTSKIILLNKLPELLGRKHGGKWSLNCEAGFKKLLVWFCLTRLKAPHDGPDLQRFATSFLFIFNFLIFVALIQFFFFLTEGHQQFERLLIHQNQLQKFRHSTGEVSHDTASQSIPHD